MERLDVVGDFKTKYGEAGRREEYMLNCRLQAVSYAVIACVLPFSVKV